MHGINDHLEVHCFQPRHDWGQIQFSAQPIEVLVPPWEPCNLGLDWRCDSAGSKPAFYGCGEIPFHGASEGAFDLQPEPFRGVMARSDHEGSKGLTLDDGPAAGWGWDGCVR